MNNDRLENLKSLRPFIIFITAFVTVFALLSFAAKTQPLPRITPIASANGCVTYQLEDEGGKHLFARCAGK
jgi:hypothetical protein